MKTALVTLLLTLALPALAADGDVQPQDLTGTPEARQIGDAIRAKIQAHGLKAGPSLVRSAPVNGMTVSDYGRITVVRDATGGVWGKGVGVNDLFNGLSGSIDAYYAAHPDADPQFIMVVQDWLNAGLAGAFYNPVSNDVAGIGYRNSGADVFDDDPTSALEGYIWMNGIQFFTEVPNHELFSRILWGQEFAHRWGAFVHFNDGGQDSGELLGRQDAHWSWYLDSNWSWMEGNDWKNNNDGTFTTDIPSFDTQTHYNPLDLYAMGLVGTADVPAFTLLLPATPGNPAKSPDAWQSANDTIAATAKTVTIQDIVAVEGPRVPDFHTSRKDNHVVVIYALRRGDRLDATKIATMNGVLDQMLASWDLDVGGRATMEFGPQGTPLPAPSVTLSAPETSKQHRPVRFDASNASEPSGKPLHWFWRFDDGEKTKFVEGGPVVEHVFGNEGEKVIEVSVRTEDGAEVIATHHLHVDAAGKYSCAVSSEAGPPLSAIVAALAAVGIAARRRRQP